MFHAIIYKHGKFVFYKKKWMFAIGVELSCLKPTTISYLNRSCYSDLRLLMGHLVDGAGDHDGDASGLGLGLLPLRGGGLEPGLDVVATLLDPAPLHQLLDQTLHVYIESLGQVAAISILPQSRVQSLTLLDQLVVVRPHHHQSLYHIHFHHIFTK